MKLVIMTGDRSELDSSPRFNEMAGRSAGLPARGLPHQRPPGWLAVIPTWSPLRIRGHMAR